tara:strand:- start:11717 stop:11878 length:162 start_codon:yes stop_codon:yes gene_type:complete
MTAIRLILSLLWILIFLLGAALLLVPIAIGRTAEWVSESLFEPFMDMFDELIP